MAPQLHRFVQECLHSVDERRDHDLTLGRRRQLWSLIGPIGPIKQPATRSQWTRFHLARLALEHVGEAFQVFPQHGSIVAETAELGRNLLDRQVSEVDGWQRHGEIWTLCDDLASRHPEFHAQVCVGYGAAQLIAMCLRDELLSDSDPLELTDMDVDPEEFDCSFCAAAAFSGGPVWMDGSSAERRREFWRWWLREALPTALQT